MPGAKTLLSPSTVGVWSIVEARTRDPPPLSESPVQCKEGATIWQSR
jgi:hypothetical protein